MGWKMPYNMNKDILAKLAFLRKFTQNKCAEDTESSMLAAEELKRQNDAEREELKTLAKQKVRDIARHKDNAEILEETYDALIEEANARIEGLTNQLAMVADTANMIVRVNRVSKTVKSFSVELALTSVTPFTSSII